MNHNHAACMHVELMRRYSASAFAENSHDLLVGASGKILHHRMDGP